jgi:DHA1 family bicyclomycin/chloramphenicol resistance-like MFS transporter
VTSLPDLDRPAGDGAAAKPLPHVPLWLLGLLTFSGTLAMHIFVPALPSAGADLGAGAAAMQFTVSVYIFGLAVGQLIYGPLADRFGRRPVLMAGLVIYILAGAAAGLAPGIDPLIAARLLQALGGCAGLVLARAIVRDTAPPAETARRLALMNLMVTVGPGVAPIIGGAIAEYFGWRLIFVLLCALGVANFLFAWRLLPETRQPMAHGGGSLARN